MKAVIALVVANVVLLIAAIVKTIVIFMNRNNDNKGLTSSHRKQRGRTAPNRAESKRKRGKNDKKNHSKKQPKRTKKI